MTPAQDAALKTALLASTDPQLQAAITGGNDTFVADWCNANHSPDYWVWRSDVRKSEIYKQASSNGTVLFDWTIFKNQPTSEQGAWGEMFSEGTCDFGQVNNRAGVGKIFTGSVGQNAQRDHALEIGRRLARRSEKLLAAAVVNPPANTGNNTANARGAATNPDVLTIEGSLTPTDIARILRGTQ